MTAATIAPILPERQGQVKPESYEEDREGIARVFGPKGLRILALPLLGAESLGDLMSRMKNAIWTLSACAPRERCVEDRQLSRDGRLQSITDQYMRRRSGFR